MLHLNLYKPYISRPLLSKSTCETKKKKVHLHLHVLYAFLDSPFLIEVKTLDASLSLYSDLCSVLYLFLRLSRDFSVQNITPETTWGTLYKTQCLFLMLYLHCFCTILLNGANFLHKIFLKFSLLS